MAILSLNETGLRRWFPRSFRDWSGLAAVCLVALVLGVNIYRAATQSITHDEAVTYQMFLAEKLYRIVTRYDANHHLLHTYLCLVSTTLCGVSEFALRIPSLCGGALYLVMAVRLSRRLFGTGGMFLMAVALLTLNPFVLDYLSLARGYGLALGFYLWSLLEGVLCFDAALLPPEVPHVLAGADTIPPATSTLRRLRKLSVLLALTVLSNLTFLLVCVSLATLLAGLLLATPAFLPEARNVCARIGELARALVRPGLFLFCTLGIALVRARRADFYVGEESAIESLRGIVGASLAHHHTQWLWDTSSAAFHVCIDALSVAGAGLLIAVVGGLALRSAWIGLRRKTGLSDLSRIDRTLLLVGGSLVLTLLLIIGLHLILHVKYPFERTGLYLVPLTCLCAVAAIRKLSTRRGTRFIGQAAFALCGAIVMQFVGQFHTSYYRTWQYDAATRQVFTIIEQRHALAPEKSVRVACSWTLEPSLNFYRRSRGATWMEEVQRTAEQPAYDYYVLSPSAPLGVEGVVPLFRDDVSGTVLAVPEDEVPTAIVSQVR